MGHNINDVGLTQRQIKSNLKGVQIGHNIDDDIMDTILTLKKYRKIDKATNQVQN